MEFILREFSIGTFHELPFPHESDFSALLIFQNDDEKKSMAKNEKRTWVRLVFFRLYLSFKP